MGQYKEGHSSILFHLRAIPRARHHDDICNVDLMTAASEREMKVVEATDLDLNVANNIIPFRLNEESCQREMRIVKIEGTGHPLEWIPFEITSEGIEPL
jgi:KaiC/GvpD/RAD55 family RecA-like ATPase